MAFCDKCGAYIPDGQTDCLACGYDKAAAAEEPAAEQAAAAAFETARDEERAAPEDSGKYYSFSNEELREKLEQQRKKQQETSRRWAEQEKARREANSSGRPGGDFDARRVAEEVGEKAKKAASKVRKNNRLFSTLSYLGPLFILPFLLCRDDRFALYHAKQGAVLFLFGILCEFLDFVPLLGLFMKIFFYYCIYKGMMNSINEQTEPLPYIGQLGERF